MNKFGNGERADWRGFPQVIRNGDLGTLKSEPEYLEAKSGDMLAAIALVDRLLTDDTIQSVRGLIGYNKPALLPVLAVEAAGSNMIPLAMAEVLADRLGLEVELGVVQRDKVGRTNKGADYRLAFSPTFEGRVEPGKQYLLLDDTLSMGGTIASLRGYVQNRGGEVLGASVMTAHQGALDLPIKKKMLEAIDSKHGAAVNQFWKGEFGYGIEQLTQGEAGHLKSAKTVDEIRDRIFAARYEKGEQLGPGRVEAPPRAKRAERSGLAGDDLLTAAVAEETDQQSMLEAASLDQSYQETLAVYTQAKHDQVGHIEERIEGLIDRQQARLQQAQTSQPGFVSLPSDKKSCQAGVAQQQARLLTLHNRLESVREIKEGMGLHSPRIEELATRKMRAHNPELAGDWDAMKQAARQHQVLVRKLESERKQSQERGRGQSLGLSQPPQS